MTTAIEFDGLTKRYDGIAVVDDVSLSVDDGEIYGLVGPNGAGKSTMINVLVGFTRPTSGTVSVFGLDTRADSVAVRRRVGVLPDRFDVFPRLSGRRHLKYALEVRDVSGTPEEYLRRVNLEDAGDKAAEDYSRGMQQRLALAMALVGSPDILVLDEPFTGLDPDGTRLLRQIIREENERGATILFSSHLLDHVDRVCTHIGLLSDGQLVAEGTPDELRSGTAKSQQYVLEIDGDVAGAASRLRTHDKINTVVRDGNELTVNCATDLDRDELLAFVEQNGNDIAIKRFVADASIEDLYVAYTGEN